MYHIDVLNNYELYQQIKTEQILTFILEVPLIY